MRYNTTGGKNTALGYYSLSSNIDGWYNVALGQKAGRYIADGATDNQNSHKSLYLGANTKAEVNGGTNEIVIGYNATGEGSNSVVLGNNDITKTILKGRIGIGTTNPTRKLFVNGDAGGTSGWYNDSDERLKKNIYTIPNALEKVTSLRGVNFEWKDNAIYPKGEQVGFIAQEIKEILPEVVDKRGEYYGVSYGQVTALLTEAVKELSSQVKELENRIKELEAN
jgi:hypothetical protein